MVTSLTSVPSQMLCSETGGDAIKINYYNGSIELQQNDNSISIEDEDIDALFKAIKKGRKEADIILERK